MANILIYKIEGKTFKTTEQYITGEELKKQGNIPLDVELYLAVRKPFEDELIENSTRVNLARPDIEQFFCKKKLYYFTKVSHPLKHQLFSFSFVCLPPYPLTVNTCLTEVMQTIHILRPIFPTLQPLQGFCSSLCRFR